MSRFKMPVSRSVWSLTIALALMAASTAAWAQTSEREHLLEEVFQDLDALRADPVRLDKARQWLDEETDRVLKQKQEADANLSRRQSDGLDGSSLGKAAQNLSQRFAALENAQRLLQAVTGPEAPPLPQTATVSGDSPKIDFVTQIRPLFANHCLTCHGPDEAKRKANLRLDDAEGVARVIQPGHPEASEIFRRLITTDPEDRMPPHESGEPLSGEEIALVREWIAQGGKVEEHWAFVTPERPSLPAVARKDWPRNPIDTFILARLEQEGLEPSPEADKRTLIRRLSLDLTGLPPSMEEVDRFLADRAPDAYEQLVDRLLTSKHYGEQMAMFWLDLARYADSDGYHMDIVKSMWQYRDWVIDAFNTNKPFDEFTIEQLAGDLLPNPSTDQLIATAFNRNGMTNTEGGADPAEYLTMYVRDRVNTTGQVWLGMTVGCCECHDHKYDPISQKEYYQLYDYFNQIPEKGLDQDPCPPYLSLPSVDQEIQLARIEAEIGVLKKNLEKGLSEPDADLDTAQRQWEEETARQAARDWVVLEPTRMKSQAGAEFTTLEDGSLVVNGPLGATDVYTIRARTNLERISSLRLELLSDPSLPNNGPGRASNGNVLLSEIEVKAWPLGDREKMSALELSQPKADHEQTGFPIMDALDGDPVSGWAVLENVGARNVATFAVKGAPSGQGDKILETTLRFESPKGVEHTFGHFRLSASSDREPQLGVWHALGPFEATSAQASFAAAFGPETELDLAKTYREGELSWVQHPEWKDGEIQDLKHDRPAAYYLYRNLYSDRERSLLFSFGSNDGIQAWLNGERILAKDVGRQAAPDQDQVAVRLKPGDNPLLVKINNQGGGFSFYFTSSTDLSGGADQGIYDLLELAREERDATQEKELREHFRLNHSDRIKGLDTQLAQARESRKNVNKSIPTLRIMQDMDEKRPTNVLIRGDYRRLGEAVSANVPAFLKIPLPEVKNNRLALARWFVDPRNPLVSRVTVNRYWQRIFGIGLVKTSEDFGTRAELPSHPELLDWLAVEFVESGWDIKAMQRLLVTSATYRQSSRVAPHLFQKDPKNRLLARGARFRLPAETIRDNALAIAGLLDRDRPVGGPSVKPYQPANLWKEKAIFDGEGSTYVQDHGDDLYRRGLYTFLKRSVPYPPQITFDAPSRETSTCRREITNTPLQAFVGLNEDTFVEAARHFAEKILRQGGKSTDDRIQFAIGCALLRTPQPKEAEILRTLESEVAKAYAANVEAASQYVSIGESPVPTDLALPELATWTAIASSILNLDETVTKE